MTRLLLLLTLYCIILSVCGVLCITHRISIFVWVDRQSRLEVIQPCARQRMP